MKVLRSYDYLINDNYNRIKSGKDFDTNFKHYTKDFIKEMISYFEKGEEYEKCQILSKYLENRFDHEKNYLLK